MDFTELTGSLAAMTTTLCWLPQAVQIIRTKETAGVSTIAYGAFAVGVALWLAYGIMIGSRPVTAANLVTLLLVLVILGLKLFYGRRGAKCRPQA